MHYAYDRLDMRPVTVDLHASLKAETGWIATLGSGWGVIGRTGTPVAAPTAKLEVPLPGQPRDDMVIDVMAGLTPSSDGQPAEVDITVNGQRLGGWKIASGKSKRLLLPAKTAALRNPLQITFAASSKPGAVEIRELTIRDVSLLGDFAGHVDVCSRSEVAGWAKSGDGPGPIVLVRNGKSTRTIIPAVDRPDLPPAGHPLDAGFVVPLNPPAAPGEAIEVRFANGTPVRGVRCVS